MPRTDKEFESWRKCSQPVKAETVRATLRYVFGDRVVDTSGSGSSHELKIRVPELAEAMDLDRYRFGIVRICVAGGQSVKPVYLRNAYEAACLLGLWPEDDNEEQEDA